MIPQFFSSYEITEMSKIVNSVRLVSELGPSIEGSNFLLLGMKVLAISQKRNQECVTKDFLVLLGIFSQKSTLRSNHVEANIHSLILQIFIELLLCGRH